MGSAELATKEVDLFVYLGRDSSDGSINIQIARIPYACVYGDFIAGTTDEKAKMTGSNTGAPKGLDATDPVVNIGRFAATLSAGAGYTWTVPTFTSINLIQRPIYETRVLSWQPTYSAGGSMTFTSVTTTHANYIVRGLEVWFCLYSTGITGGTASTTCNATVPFTSLNNCRYGGLAFDGGGLAARVDIAATSACIFQKYDSSNWGLGAGRIIGCTATYTI
jgi:hypothetical protein